MNNEAYWKENYNAVVAERDRLAAELERSKAAHVLKDYLQRGQQRELEQYRQAEKDGLLVRLLHEDEPYGGLKIKYYVFKAKNGEPVKDCFVLRPDKDEAARAALITYARTCENEQLSKDILNWTRSLWRADAEQALKGLEQ